MPFVQTGLLTSPPFSGLPIRIRKVAYNGQKGSFFQRPLQNLPFCPISASDENFNPRNTQCITVVKIFAFLELEQK